MRLPLCVAATQSVLLPAAGMKIIPRNVVRGLSAPGRAGNQGAALAAQLQPPFPGGKYRRDWREN